MALTVDDIIKMSPKRKAIVVVILILLLGYFYFFYFLQPAFGTRAQLKENLENLDRQIAARQRVVKQIERHKKEIVELEKNLQEAVAKLPEQKEIPGLLTSISEAGQREGLENLLFKPSEPVAREFYKELPVDIIIMGNYHDIALFFDRVANLPRIVNITDIKMQKSRKQGAETDNLTAQCLLKTYMFMEPEEEGKPADEKKQ